MFDKYDAIRREHGPLLSDEEFQKVLAYTVHKSRVTGHDDSYIELLLPDEINSYIFMEYTQYALRDKARAIAERRAADVRYLLAEPVLARMPERA